MQGVVVVDRRGLTAVGATRMARGYMICMRGRPRAREGATCSLFRPSLFSDLC
jgi:hypothetical protein